jgi:hypothetical protein
LFCSFSFSPFEDRRELELRRLSYEKQRGKQQTIEETVGNQVDDAKTLDRIAVRRTSMSARGQRPVRQDLF